MTGTTTRHGPEKPSAELSAVKEPRPESNVIARIDELITESLERGPYGQYGYGSCRTFEPCEECGHDFHGLPCVQCACGHDKQPYVDQIKSVTWTHDVSAESFDGPFYLPTDPDTVIGWESGGITWTARVGDSREDVVARFNAMLETITEIYFQILGLGGINVSSEILQGLCDTGDHDETRLPAPRPEMCDPPSCTCEGYQEPGT